MKSLSFLILLITLLSCSIENQSTYDLLIQNSNLIDGTGGPMISNVHIYVQDGRISDITSQPIEGAISDNVNDGMVKYIIPGLLLIFSTTKYGIHLPN